LTEPTFDEILRLERIDDHLYRGITPPGAFAPNGIYGGQLVAQALRAADQTAHGRPCNSLHAYYLRAGDPALPVLYAVEPVRDGRTFATRRVTASQEGRRVLDLTASFKLPEPGPVHQGRMPQVLHPDDPALGAKRADWETAAFHGLPMELRRVTPTQLPPPLGHPAVQRLWFRATAPFADEPAMHQAVLAYISDMALLSTAMLPHGLAWSGAKAAASSLDHALWCHRPSDLRQWHLFDQQSPSAEDARGLSLGSIWRLDGVLVATAAQEGLIRPV
jgi:acyl-CoA thioesterase-2